jgi:hypothetical protein
MVSWDLTIDPMMSTINGSWVWHNGGSYFGVPVSNFLGWYLTVYVFFQCFALYARAFSSEADTGSREENVSNRELEPPFRFHRNGEGSRRRSASHTKMPGYWATPLFAYTSIIIAPF